MGEMQLNDIGQIVFEEWMRTPTIRTEIELDYFIIMPNHIHGIVIINDANNNPDVFVGTHGRASLQRKPRSLGSFVAGFKSIVTKRVNMIRMTPGEPIWQTRYHDHIIRNEVDLHRIRTYIANNPLQWALDEENPANMKRTSKTQRRKEGI